ncbi:hypothetical protein MLD38_010487 [Melastoma candidum]|uniref:Uncharacterized protein n=1 Tax=Melastoma candidum TaxID=119954 RepID=A0ACB9R342_9MYRT|nr:hypothetical protein MLD38_010487 [Melastoma candidum]
MESVSVTPITTASIGGGTSCFCSFRRTAVGMTRSSICFRRGRKKVGGGFSTYAAKGDAENPQPKPRPELNSYDLMELKFGKLLGEDPKLTLAKIMGRKANPEVSYLDIERSFYKKKGNFSDVAEVPFEDSRRKNRSSSSLTDGLDLVRPVPREPFEYENNDNKLRTLNAEIPEQIFNEKSPAPRENVKRNVPNVILRKPTMFREDSIEDKPSRLKVKRNLSIRMSNQPTEEKFSQMELLRKPEPSNLNSRNISENSEPVIDSGHSVGENVTSVPTEEETQWASDKFTLLMKPKSMKDGVSFTDVKEETFSRDQEANGQTSMAGQYSESMRETELLNVDLDAPHSGMLELDGGSDTEKVASSPTIDANNADSNFKSSPAASLLQKPRRLDKPTKVVPPNDGLQASEAKVTMEDCDANLELSGLSTASSLNDLEEADWARAEDLVKTGEKVEVELLRSSTKGFMVSFGSLIGFLPYRNLAARWKFLAFESWLRQKGLDPSMYRQNLGVIGSYDSTDNYTSTTGGLDPDNISVNKGEISPEMKLEDLLKLYDQEKLKFLSTFIGQRLNVSVVMADRRFRKLVVSLKPREKEELVEKKRSLMAKLRVGDVVKCRIKKITYFGIFVEVEDVPALIHQTEVSWDVTLDPASHFTIDQIVEAKVHQLDFALDRIFLSLRGITPDPLSETLEAVVGDGLSLDGKFEAAEAESEWLEVESLIKELQQIEGVRSVSKGRYFLSPGLAPTFQVYMAAMFEDKYKLLARSGNRIQEIMVEASLDNEQMKSVILACTNRVE